MWIHRGVINPKPYEICKGTQGAEESKGIDGSVVVVADIAASVLARLRNKAKAAGISYQQCLIEVPIKRDRISMYRNYKCYIGEQIALDD